MNTSVRFASRIEGNMGASLNTVWWSGVIATEEEEYIEDNQIEYPGDPTEGSP